jgi:hypothetical protein
MRTVGAGRRRAAHRTGVHAVVHASAGAPWPPAWWRMGGGAAPRDVSGTAAAGWCGGAGALVPARVAAARATIVVHRRMGSPLYLSFASRQ